MDTRLPIEVEINGRRRSFDVDANQTLLEVLREDLELTGSKECCLVGECGACTVMLNGQAVDSCLVLAVEADGGSVTTVEGLSRNGQLAPLQAAFLDRGAVQCGFCIPGQLVSAHALLSSNPHPSPEEIQEGMAGNLCRCGCYYQIFDAISSVASAPDEATR